MTASVAVPLCDRSERTIGTLHLSCLAGKEQWKGIDTLVDLRSDPDVESVEAPVQLLEETSYGYRLDLIGPLKVVGIQPAELVSHTRDHSFGRLEARRATGTVRFEVTLSNGTAGACELEIRSRKLDYRTDYRAMLRRIAGEAAELVQSAFAASSLRGFRPNTFSDPETLYQRFAFMQSILDSPDVQNALSLIGRRPHHEHVESVEQVDPGRGVRSSRLLAREFMAAGPRQHTARPIAGMSAVPHRVQERAQITTYDTVPNRFVRYVLTRWRDLAEEVADRLGAVSEAEQRGQREAQVTAEALERALATPALNDAGRLDAFPQSNQVLQGRAGYRDLLEAFLLAEAAATIDWRNHERLFSAGQRDVADLYEHWVFLELVRIVESLPGFAADRRGLVRRSADGLTLDLSRSGRAVVVAEGFRRGRPVVVEVWFNKSFPHGDPVIAGTSWTEQMRPDCSLRIAPSGGALGADTWVHFDAKYRIRSSSEVVAGETDEEQPHERDAADRPVSQDLMKMHAYRDAIRRTAGAYVLYPGSDHAQQVDRRQYHEILPGLGAFVLRPTDTGEASRASSKALQSFLEEIIDHVAAQGTSAERVRYWTDRSYQSEHGVRLEHEPALVRPARDTEVLLGFVRSPEHLEWCYRTGLYNLRADPHRRGSVGLSSPELAANIVVLYGAETDETWTFGSAGAFYLRSADELNASGYSGATGQQYVCLEIRPLSLITKLDGALVRELARTGLPVSELGAPRVLTWEELSGSVS